MEISDELYQKILESWTDKATREQQTFVMRWRQESPEHESCYWELFRLHCRVNAASKYGKIDVEAARLSVMRQLSESRKKGHWRLYVWRGVVAASVLVALALFSVWKAEDREIMQQNADRTIGGQGAVTLVLGNGQEFPLSRDSSFELKVGNVNVQQHSGEGLYYVGETDSLLEETLVEYNAIRVPRGGEYMLTLSDGTKVWLNSVTDLRFPVAFPGKVRKVYLEGEAYFDVAHRDNQPFVVVTSNLEVKVYGTEFNVNTYEAGRVKVVLVDGSVGVHVPALNREISVLPNQLAEYAEGMKDVRISEVDPLGHTAWRNGEFVFYEESVEKIMERLARWYDIQVSYINDDVRKQTFSGIINRFERVEDVLRLIEEVAIVRFEIKGNTVLVKPVNRDKYLN